MTSETVIYLILGGLAGGFVNGFSGTGTALFALSFLLVVLPPESAVAVVTLLSILAGVQGLWVIRKTIPTIRPRLLRFIVPGLIGLPLGLMLLNHVDASQLRRLVAGLLIVYGLYFGLRASLPRFERRTPVADSGIGFLGGLLGGLAGLSGALPVIWVSMRPWPKEETRALLQSINIVILSTTVTALALRGAYDTATVAAIAVVLPAGLLAAQVGIFAFRRISDTVFRRSLILMCLALGIGILLRDLI